MERREATHSAFRSSTRPHMADENFPRSSGPRGADIPLLHRAVAGDAASPLHKATSWQCDSPVLSHVDGFCRQHGGELQVRAPSAPWEGRKHSQEHRDTLSALPHLKLQATPARGLSPGTSRAARCTSTHCLPGQVPAQRGCSLTPLYRWQCTCAYTRRCLRISVSVRVLWPQCPSASL